MSVELTPSNDESSYDTAKVWKQDIVIEDTSKEAVETDKEIKEESDKN